MPLQACCGRMLQAYALQSVLEDMGHDAVLLDRTCPDNRLYRLAAAAGRSGLKSLRKLSGMLMPGKQPSDWRIIPVEYAGGFISRYIRRLPVEDYMRLPDVILPRALWEQYGLVQDRELPPYDFCYCERCLKLFAEQYGRAPLEDPTQDAEWREFRLASVARLANALCDEIRLRNKYAACAVFPTPEIAARLVRQDWSRFRLDLALPMDYYSFYAEPRSWLGRVLSEARRQTQDRFELAPGLHLPDVRPDELPRELDLLYRGGARRIALVGDSASTPEHAAALRRWRDALRDTRRPEALAP